VTLSIIIVNYNVKKLLEACLYSVEKAIQGVDAEVLIVDNASSDDSVAHLRSLFPSYRLIENTSNKGFAKANNQGLSFASGKYVLFLNPDTVVPPDCIRKCIDFLHSHPLAGALGVKMFNGNGKFLPESKRGFPSPLVSFWKLAGISRIFPRSEFFSKYYMGHLDENATHEVDVLSGAFMMVKKEVLDKIGGFDERFFMYAEDIDLSYRIQKAGYKNYYLAETSILHYKGGSTKKNATYVRHFYRAMSQFVKKHYGAGIYTSILDAAITAFTLFSSLRVAFSRRTSRRANGLLP
jgi:GT2 family glycosyltransferase